MSSAERPQRVDSAAPADHSWMRSMTTVRAITITRDCVREPVLSGVVRPGEDLRDSDLPLVVYSVK